MFPPKSTSLLTGALTSAAMSLYNPAMFPMQQYAKEWASWGKGNEPTSSITYRYVGRLMNVVDRLLPETSFSEWPLVEHVLSVMTTGYNLNYFDRETYFDHVFDEVSRLDVINGSEPAKILEAAAAMYDEF